MPTDQHFLTIAEAASLNVSKIHSRWPEQRTYSPLFDEGFDALEQFPRKITMHIFERKRGDKTYVIQQCNGLNVGSALTDPTRGRQRTARCHRARPGGPGCRRSGLCWRRPRAPI